MIFSSKSRGYNTSAFKLRLAELIVDNKLGNWSFQEHYMIGVWFIIKFSVVDTFFMDVCYNKERIDIREGLL